jgi:hypothetical protein
MQHHRETEQADSPNAGLFEPDTLWGCLVQRSAFYRSLAGRADAVVGHADIVALCGPPGSGRRSLATSILAKRAGTTELLIGDPADELPWLSQGVFSIVRVSWAAEVNVITSHALLWDTALPVPESVQRRLHHVLEHGRSGQRQYGPLIILHDGTRGRLRDQLIPEFARMASLCSVELPSVGQRTEAVDIAVDYCWAAMTQAFEREGLQADPMLTLSVRDLLKDRLREVPLEHNFRDVHALVHAYGREVMELRRPGAAQRHANELISQLCSHFVTENAIAGPSVLARRVVTAYVAGQQLDNVLSANSAVSWRRIQEELQLWLGEQVQQTARNRGCAEGELIDISQRQLQNWRRRTPNS